MKLYRCEHCGNIVEKIHDSGVKVVCCGENMKEIELHTEIDDKHTPVIKNEEGHSTIEVGSLIHPQTDDHFIHFIFVVKGNAVVRYDVSKQEMPIVKFNVEDDIDVYSYCNVHGFYKNI